MEEHSKGERGNNENEHPISQGDANIDHNLSGSTTSAPQSSNHMERQQEDEILTQKKPSVFKRAWTKLGITPLVVVFMVKPSLAITISAAIYQSYGVAKIYLNFGFLIMIVSVLTVPMLPRGKFLLNLFLSVLLVCFGAAMVLFGQWCAIKAREHTTPNDAPLAVQRGYNSSAAAVNAIFLIVNIFGISVLRAARPVFAIPSVVYTVFVLVGFVYGPSQYSEFRSKRFTREIFYAFLTGQAISTGVSLIVIPVSSRKVFFGETIGFLQTCRQLLKAEQAFIEVLEHSGECDETRRFPGSEDKVEVDIDAVGRQAIYDARAAALKTAATNLLGLGAKLREDVVFAKREIAFGHLQSNDIHRIHQLIRKIMIPITGLSTLVDISERLIRPRERATSTGVSTPHNTADVSDSERSGWHELISALNPSFREIIQVLDQSFVHILVLLKLIPKPKVTRQSTDEDVEKGLQPPRPGEVGFGNYLEQQIKGFREQRTAKLQLWAEERGLSEVFHTSAEFMSTKHAKEEEFPDATHLRVSQRLHIVLYMEYLLYSTSNSVLTMVRYAEAKVDDGTMSKQKFIFPTFETVRKLIRGLVKGEDSSPDVNQLDNAAGHVENVYLGEVFGAPKDPEHLPPKNAFQRFGNRIRTIPRLLGSDSAKFGARVVIAVMSITIMAYLKNTRAFFIRQRVVWGVVMIAIGMSPTSGSAVFALLGNLTATLFGMIGAFINWYIVDQKTPGVIVIMFFCLMFYFYFAAKNQRFLVAIVAGAVTHILVIGNELEVRVIGKAIYTATGLPYYPVYELAPYRLLTVGGGCLVAYIWTIFPVPITEGSVLRKDLGSSVFLLAKYITIVTSSVDLRLQEAEGDTSLKSSPGRRLKKAYLDVLAKEIVLLNSMRQNLAFMAWEPRLGGDFPRETYEALIKEVQNVVNYLTIIAYASEAFTNARASEYSTTWLTNFAATRNRTDHKSHKIASLLALLSAAITNNQPLPPYTKAPRHFSIAANPTVDDGKPVLGLHNIDEPGFRAVAVIEVAHECLTDSINVIVGLVRELVGELDFSYGVLNSNSSLGSSVDGRESGAKMFKSAYR